MFIRESPTRSNATGERYFTYRLVENVRVGGKVKQLVIHNLGRHFPIDQAYWRPLAQRIEELLAAQAVLIPLDLPPLVEREAQRIAALLMARQGAKPKKKSDSSGSPEPPIAAETPPTDIQAVDVDSLELLRPRSVGVEHLGLWAMHQVGFFNLLTELGISGQQRMAIVGSIIGRMAEPGSELATWRWLQNESGLGELLDFDFEQRLPLRALYRASDTLMRHRSVIESALFNRACDLFGLTPSIVLYDLTHTYFEGTQAANPKAQRGRSKEKRTDCPLVTLGLVLDSSGFTRRSETFEGNLSEPRSLEVMLQGLGAVAGSLVAMDAGIASEANLAWLRERGYRYLVVSRERMRQFNPAAALPITTAGGAQVRIERVTDEEGAEVRLYCHSEERQRKEEGINERFCDRFEAGLKRIAEGLAKPRAEKRLDKLHERIGRLKEKSRGVGQHYTIQLIPDESGERATALQWERTPQAGTMLTHPGVYCLRTNQTDWDSERLWRTYTLLTDLEAVFRSLKSELGLRPVFHHNEGRVDGHLFITVLAYQFVQIIRRRLDECGISDSWASLRTTARIQRRVTASFRRADGRQLHARKATQPEVELRAIYSALGLSPTPGNLEKTIV
jgi:transposase